jgi:dihydrofolate synthase/folylpolyglutamate synthase
MRYPGMNSGLTGHSQIRNLRTAIAAITSLQESGFELGPDEVAAGLAGVQSLTGIRGRWDILSTAPRIVADCAHNPAGLAQLFEQVRGLAPTTLHIVFGAVRDKDPHSNLAELPDSARYYFCRPDVPRGLDAEQLAEFGKKHGLKGRAYASVQEAFEEALEYYRPSDLLLITGSTFVVAELPFEKYPIAGS